MANNAIATAKTVAFNGEVISTSVGGANPNFNFTLGQKLKTTLTSAVTGTPTFTFPGVGHYQLRIVSGAFGFAFPAPSATWQWLGSATAPPINNGTYGGMLTLFWDGTMITASYSKIGAA